MVLNIKYILTNVLLILIVLNCSSDKSLSFNSSEARQLPSNDLRVLIIGNSITPKSANGDWIDKTGLAASKPYFDYVHLLNQYIIDKTGSSPQIKAVSGTAFETGFDTFPLSVFDIFKDFDPHLVIIRISDNVNATKAVQNKYWKYYSNLMTYFKNYPSNPLIINTSSWYQKGMVDSMVRVVAQEHDLPYVDISYLYDDLTNHASSERSIDDPDVASHPGDKGMKAIADVLWKIIEPLII